MSRIKVACWILLVIGLVSPFGEAIGAIYYISPTGNDGNPGTSVSPLGTFPKAMTVLLPGDTLILKDGIYNQAINVSVSGTADKHLIIKAENDGKAIVDAKGYKACLINGRSYVDVEGIIFQNSYDNVVEIASGSDHITLRRVSAYNAGDKLSPILGANSTNILVEDCVASSQPGVGYIAINFNNCDHVTIRRCFTFNADPNIVLYETDNSLVENNIVMTPTFGTSYGTHWGMTVNATSTNRGNNNTFRGNVVLGNATGQTFYGAFGVTNRAGGHLLGNTFDNNVAINMATYQGIKIESNTQTSDTQGVVSNNTLVMNRADLPNLGTGALISAAPFASSDIILTSVTNNSLLGNMNPLLRGLEVDSYPYITVTNTYNNFYNIALNYGGDAAAGRGEKALNPAYDTATYGYGAYLMIPPVLQGAGANGADIGAKVLYRYQDGVLTNAPLWPWAMEDRIVSELGISPTWLANGGIWKTLDGVYVVYAVNAGGSQYTDATKVVYQSDTNYSGGSTYSTTAPIGGTADGTLYQTIRYGNFSYDIPLANGNYTVTLKFAEIYWTGTGQRVFNVSMQGKKVLSNLDIFAHVGKNAAYDVSVPASVVNGVLNIQFTNVADNAVVSAIVISKDQVQATAGNSIVFADHAGGGQYTDQSGIVYQADTNYSGGAAASTTFNIAGTSDSPLYQTLRYGNFSYNIPLNNGNYNVILKFAETFWPSVGQRVFNVSMQGQKVLSNMDIFAKAGLNTAYDVSIPVSVANGVLNIQFSSVVDNAILSAIMVQTVSGPVNSPSMQVSPASLNFIADEGTNPQNQTINLSNSGGGTLNWNAVADNAAPAWLSVGPANGTGGATLTAVVNSASLAPGQYSKNITISSPGATNTPQTVSVSLTVNPKTASNTTVALNSGGGQYTDQSGVVYQTDLYYAGGAIASTSANIAGTADSSLYQSVRYGNFSYYIPLTNGNYTVTLKLAEIYWDKIGARVFNVSVQGQKVLNNLDIYAQVGINAVYDVAIPVNVTDGMLNIGFSSVVDAAIVSAVLVQSAAPVNPPSIQVSPASLNFIADQGTNPQNQTINLSNSGGGTLNWTAVADNAVPAWLSVSPANGTGGATLTAAVNSSSLAPGQYSKNITISNPGATNTPQTVTVTLTVNPKAASNTALGLNAGGGQYKDQSGVVYQADIDYSGGATAVTYANIAGTADGSLYQSVRYGNFSYYMPLNNGNYTVTLKLAEVYWEKVGGRVFNVSVQGQKVLNNLDIYAHVGKNAAYDVAIPVSVTNGILNIGFSTVVDAACVSAILITQ